MDIVPHSPGGSPFDSIMRHRDDGAEYWSGRELMPLMGYARWEDFAKVTRRALASAANVNRDQSFAEITEELTGGRPRANFLMDRFGAYLVAMNGDPNMPEVAAAQAYFAVRTREAEVARPQLPTDYESALVALLESVREKKVIEATVQAQGARLRLVEPKAEAFDRWLGANVGYPVDVVAKALKAAGVKAMGRNRLFDLMAEKRWIYRISREWHAYQPQMDAKRLTHKLGRYEDSHSGEQVPTVTIRITPKGVADLAALTGVSPEAVASNLEGAADAA